MMRLTINRLAAGMVLVITSLLLSGAGLPIWADMLIWVLAWFIYSVILGFESQK